MEQYISTEIKSQIVKYVSDNKTHWKLSDNKFRKRLKVYQ